VTTGRPARARTATAVRFRPEVYERLRTAAEERELTMNWLVNKAVEQFLERLLPVDEIVWTRDGSQGGAP
jgi:predicted transcriptional regulator